VTHKTKSQLVKELTKAADNLRKVRAAGAIAKLAASSAEPDVIQTAQSVIAAGAVAQGKAQG